jgi:NAD(P)-dependent dehydrogenase (short-subunit alcohol dehydrogenase family)
MGRLAGKAAIVTGAANGIGRATAIAMAAEGAAVLVADLDGAGAAAVAAQIAADDGVRDGGGQALAFQLDVSDEDAVATMVGTAVDAFGRLDVLHNNAAATGDTVNRDRGIADLPLDVWRRAFQVNVDGVFYGIRHALPHLVRAGGGSIINTSSDSAASGDLQYAAYGASKGAVDSLTYYVAVMHGKQNIRCNAIAPGLVITANARTKMSQETFEVFERHHLLPRLGDPTDVAHLAVFLASDESSWITGQVIRVDGGLLRQNPTVAHFRAHPPSQ